MNPPIRPYLNLKCHKKPFVPLLKACRKLKKLDKVYNYLYSIVYKKQKVSLKYAYPVKCAKLLIELLINSEKSVKSEFKYKSVVIKNVWVNKGASRGIRAIPRARGQSTPKYLPSTHIYIQLDNDI